MTQELFFKRQIELWGEETQSSLATKSVAIIGCGGLGCSLGLALGASGIGKIYLVDFDRVSPHNVHRQVALRMTDEGKYKADVLASLLKERSPFVDVVSVTTSFDDFSLSLPPLDLLIDATDNLPSRQKINDVAKSAHIPWLYGSVEGWNGQVAFFEKADFEVFVISDRKPGGITPPIVMFIASFQANMALRYLAGLPIVKDTLHYIYLTQEGECVIQKYLIPPKEIA